MPGTLLERIWFSCRHQFSWPRRADDGSYYQVCLQCGTKYRYDWKSMRRIARMDHEGSTEPLETAAKKPVRKCGGRDGWHPRERRLKVEVPVLYRAKGSTEWQHGHTQNISRSGLLFSAPKPLPLGATVELIFEMPAAICGETNANVLCQAKVARADSETDPPELAATIADYEFLPKGKVAGM